MKRETAAKSGKIAPFVFVNSGNFQQNWLKCVENIPIFTSNALLFRRICMSLRFCLLNSSLPCLFSALQVALPSGTLISWKKCGKWRISSVERILESNNCRVPNNHNKQWQCSLFVSCDNAHKSLRTWNVKSLAFSRVYSTQEVWLFVFSYNQIRRRDDILASSLACRQTDRQPLFQHD